MDSSQFPVGEQTVIASPPLFLLLEHGGMEQEATERTEDVPLCCLCLLLFEDAGLGSFERNAGKSAFLGPGTRLVGSCSLFRRAAVSIQLSAVSFRVNPATDGHG